MWMFPLWVLLAPDGPHVGPMILAIREITGSPGAVSVECLRRNETPAATSTIGVNVYVSFIKAGDLDVE